MKSGSSNTTAQWGLPSNPIKLSGGVITLTNGKQVLTQANSICGYFDKDSNAPTGLSDEGCYDRLAMSATGEKVVEWHLLRICHPQGGEKKKINSLESFYL